MHSAVCFVLCNGWTGSKGDRVSIDHRGSKSGDGEESCLKFVNVSASPLNVIKCLFEKFVFVNV